MPPEERKTLRRVRLGIATGLGIGYAPVVPGTFGSLPGVVLAWSLFSLGGTMAVFAGLLTVTGLGFWAAEGAARDLGRKDPGQIVVDEIAGQMLTYLLVPPTIRTLGLGFLLFRMFDILKPFPARRLEALPGGSGIMADDLAAGVYANLVLQGAVHLFPGLMGHA